MSENHGDFVDTTKICSSAKSSSTRIASPGFFNLER